MIYTHLARAAILFALVALIPTPAYAYLDPGTGSMLLSAVISVLVTTGLALQAYGYRVLRFFRSLFGRPGPADAKQGDPTSPPKAAAGGEEPAP